MDSQSHRLTRNSAGLLIVDIQERLLPQIFEKDRLIANSVLLIKGAAILASVSLLAFLFPHPIRAAESWRHCLGLGMNLMALGAFFATTPPPVQPFTPDAPKSKKGFSCCCDGCDCCDCCSCCDC